MTTPSSNKDIEHQVNAVLDAEVEHNLSRQVVRDIKQAREHALVQKHQVKQDNFSQWFSQLFQVKIIIPSAVAVTAVILVNYSSNYFQSSSEEFTNVPAMPAALLDENIPGEDLMLLKDIEFARWLALQEAESGGVVL